MWKKAFELLKKDLRSIRAVILAVLIYYIFTMVVFHSFCPFRLLTGFPCAGCGMTHACVYAGLFRFRDAWNYHPLFGPWMAYGILWAWFRYIKGTKMPQGQLLLGLLLIITIVAYVIRMICCFPDDMALYYYEENFLGRLIPAYRQWGSRFVLTH